MRSDVAVLSAYLDTRLDLTVANTRASNAVGARRRLKVDKGAAAATFMRAGRRRGFEEENGRDDDGRIYIDGSEGAVHSARRTRRPGPRRLNRIALGVQVMRGFRLFA